MCLYFDGKHQNHLNNLNHHIFICGMPRSGTTVLMRFLYDTEQFASLTYRDMPFIISPNLWSIISKRIKSGQKIERAHRDKIFINLDSPEALEEIFWRVKLNKEYIFKNKLISHNVDEFTLNEYKNFVSLILYKYKKKLCLSKNNNNILRLESILKAFPNSIIIIPFRDPAQQANSLLKQHKNFKEIQKENKFIKNYMSYLAHHEFGEIHRPFEFVKGTETNLNSNSIEYWLEQWINTYNYLSQKKFANNNNILYLDYEYFCNQPNQILKKLLKKINPSNILVDNNFSIHKSLNKIEIKESAILLKSIEIYDKLKKLCNNSFK